MKHLSRHLASRRIAAVAAAAVLAFGTLGAILPQETAYAATASTTADSSDTFDDGTLTYKKLSNTTVSVTDCIETATNISVMPEIDGYDVVSVGEEAFANCTSLQSVTVPTSVTEIGSAAFYGCTALTSISLPDTITTLESGTFFNCTALTSLELPDSLTELGDMVFGYCTALESIALPDSVTTMGDQMFYYCTALSDISFSNALTALGNYTFYGCISLKEFTIPKNITDIGAMSFVACPSLETIAVEDGNETYVAEDNALYNADKSILYLYPAGREDTSFSVPDSVLVIYAGAFFAANKLEQVTFPDSLQYIGEMAFDFCSGLTSLTIPESITTIGTTAFADCTALTTVEFVGATDEDGGEGEDLEIGDYAFFCCDSLNEVQLPKRVSSVGSYAFGCNSPEDDDEAADYVEVTSDSGDTLKVMAQSGFLLIGYTGVASDYVKDCDVDISFKSVNTDWSRILFWGVIAIVAAAVILIAVRIIRHTMMTKEEKAALQAAQDLQKVPLSQRGENAEEASVFDDGYRSILDDDEDEEEAETVVDYEQTLSHSQLHQMSHASSEELEQAETAQEPKPKE